MTVRLTLKLLGAGNGQEGVTVTDGQTEQQKQRWTCAVNIVFSTCATSRVSHRRTETFSKQEENITAGPHVSDAGRVGGAEMEKQVKTTSRANPMMHACDCGIQGDLIGCRT